MKSYSKLLPLLFVMCLFCCACTSQDDNPFVAVRDGEKLKGGSLVRFQLSGLYPNPLDSEGIVEFMVPFQQRIKLSIYSEEWQELRVLSDRIYPVGDMRQEISAENLSHGVYYLVATSEEDIQIIKFIH